MSAQILPTKFVFFQLSILKLWFIFILQNYDFLLFLQVFLYVSVHMLDWLDLLEQNVQLFHAEQVALALAPDHCLQWIFENLEQIQGKMIIIIFNVHVDQHIQNVQIIVLRVQKLMAHHKTSFILLWSTIFGE